MKKHLSVFMFIARSSIYKVLILLILMTALSTALLSIAFSRIPEWEEPHLELVFDKSGIAICFCICYALTALCLWLTGCEFGSKTGYTLRRLQISERSVFVWQSLYNTLCFFVLWTAQVLIVYGF